MPVGTGRPVLRRILALAALAAAVLLCAVLPLGSVKSIKVDEEHRGAVIELSLDDSIAPLHQGTTATIRNPSLTSIAGRYVSLIPGPNSAPEIPSGGEIPTQDTTEIVDLDQLLNSLTPPVVAALSQVVHGSADASSGRGRQLAAAIHSLNPALSRSAAA